MVGESSSRLESDNGWSWPSWFYHNMTILVVREIFTPSEARICCLDDMEIVVVGAHRGGKTIGHSHLVGVGTRGGRGGGKHASRGGGSVRSQQTQH